MLVVGLGESDKFGPEEARRAAAAALWAAEKLSIKDMATIVHGAGIGGIEPQSAAEATALGSLLAAYRFDRYKSEEDRTKPRLENLTIIERDADKLAAFQSGVKRAETIAWAQSFARDLVNEPSNVMTPAEFANRVEEVLSKAEAEVTVHDEVWIQKQHLNLKQILNKIKN